MNSGVVNAFGRLSFNVLPFLLLLIAMVCFSSDRGLIEAKRHVFRPKDLFPASINLTKKVGKSWKKKLTRRLIDRVRKITKLEKLPPFPNISKLKLRRIIQQADTSKSKYDPCRVVENICMNGGTCHSLENAAWFCNCPSTHYGKSCEFLADLTHCAGNLCRNNASCYSVKTARTVPNINLTLESVEKCKEVARGGEQPGFDCNFTLTVNYKCWCKLNFEGDFCEFSEGERCCAEEHCNHHGLIHDVFHASDDEVCDLQQHCNCSCEPNYLGENCEKISLCRDIECLNGGYCTYDEFDDTANCSCPLESKFMLPLESNFMLEGIKINGNYCEQIDYSDPDEVCSPCEEDTSYKGYLNCLRKKKIEKINETFAHYCGDRKCEDVLDQAFCLNGGECSVTVANFSLFLQNQTNPLLLIPKCECDSKRFEGDFCEHAVLDECDRKDLEMNEGAGKQEKDQLKLMKIVGTEQFLRTLKNELFGRDPLKSMQEEERPIVARAFEQALREKRMRTFCGLHGLCRPYNEEEGLICKCDAGYKGTRCEVKDPCWEFECPEHSLCVDLPAEDEEGTNLTSTCVCNTSQEIDPTTHKCMSQHAKEYKKCYSKTNAGITPNCKNDGHCYPCALDDKAVKEAGVKQTRLAICNEEEKKRGYRCICTPGLEPPDCLNASRPCDFHRCQNGASCVPVPETDNLLNYECKCRMGYSGPLCEHVEDMCIHAGSECGNGTCVADKTWRRGFRCDCFSGYYGFNCEQLERKDWIAYFNNNFNWTYPLAVLSVLTPIVLVLMVLRDKGVTIVGMFRRIRGRGNVKGNYTLLREEKGGVEEDEVGSKSKTNQAEISSSTQKSETSVP